MDRNSIIGIVIIAGILIGYTFLTKPNIEEINEQKRIADSIKVVELAKSVAEKSSTAYFDSIPKQAQTPVAQVAGSEENLGIYTGRTTGQAEFYTLENNKLKIVISSQGARPYQVELKDYKTHDKQPLMMFEGDSS